MTTEARVSIEDGVVFGRAGDFELLCDVYTPPGEVTNAPAVIVVHGGSWRGSDRKQLRGYCLLLGRMGYVCIAPEYRLSGQAQWPAQIHDLKAAVRWTRANAERLHINPDQISVMGGSAGAHLVLMLGGTQDVARFEGECGTPGVSTAVASVMSFCGITDVRPGGDFLVDSLDDLLGKDANLNRYREASPIDHVTSAYPPTFILHSSKDTTVPYRQATAMYDALLAVGVEVELYLWDREGHIFDAKREIGRLCAEMMHLFLQRYVLKTV